MTEPFYCQVFISTLEMLLVSVVRPEEGWEENLDWRLSELGGCRTHEMELCVASAQNTLNDKKCNATLE
jgi:hypothetical protein